MLEMLHSLRGQVAFEVTKAGTVRTKTLPDYTMNSTKICGDCPIIALAKQEFGSKETGTVRRLEMIRVSTLPAYWRNLDAINLGTILLGAPTEDVIAVVQASDWRHHPLRPALLKALGIGVLEEARV